MTNFNSHASCEAWRQAPCRVFQGYPHFNSHASCEAWPISWYRVFTIFSFQLTRLMRGVTDCFPVRVSVCDISTHTPHARRDWNALAVFLYLTEFQLTRLMRGVTRSSQYYGDSTFHFNSHASCEAWLSAILDHYSDDNFNSHASCEAWRMTIAWKWNQRTISTHTPHARRDLQVLSYTYHQLVFQLTRLMRGVTVETLANAVVIIDFNSHASCEAWLTWYWFCLWPKKFQLTRLMRGVTCPAKFRQ